MRVLLAVTAGAVVVGLLGARADADAEATKLLAEVDDSASIRLMHENGSPVTTLVPGAYDIDVTDSTASHNFHLTGPGVDKSTTVAGQEAPTWSLTLADGAYDYVCDPHRSFMMGHFTVASSPQPPPPGPPPPAPPPPAPPPPSAPPPPPPPPTEHPPPFATPAAALTGLSVRIAPGRIVVASLRSSRRTRAALELRRGARLVQSKRVELIAGRNVVRMQVRPSVRPGRYLLVVRTSAGRRVSHLLRLR